jgi:sporulation protein YlmC with PRC-barrel domain
MVSKMIAILVLVLALPLALFAQDTPSDVSGMGTTGTILSMGGGLYRIGQGLNVAIANESGDVSGNVQDLLIDNNGGIRFAVVSLSQGADMQADQATGYLVPIDRVSYNAGEDRFTFDVASSDVASLRTVDLSTDVAAAMTQAGEVVNPTLPATGRQAENTGNAPAQGVPGGNVVGRGISYVSARNLIGSMVINDQGDELGRVEDVVINIPQSRVQYVAMSASGELGVGERYYAVPMRTFLGLNTLTDEAVVAITTTQLRGNVGFGPNGPWPGDAEQALGSPAQSGNLDRPSEQVGPSGPTGNTVDSTFETPGSTRTGNQ